MQGFSRFDVSEGFKALVNAAVKLNVIDVLGMMEIATESKTEAEMAEYIMLCAFNNRHHKVGGEAHEALAKLNNARVRAAL